MRKFIYGVLCVVFVVCQSHGDSDKNKVLGHPTEKTMSKKVIIHAKCTKGCGTYSSKLSSKFPAAEECLLSMKEISEKDITIYNDNINFCRSLVTWFAPLKEHFEQMSGDEKDRCTHFMEEVAKALAGIQHRLPDGSQPSKWASDIAKAMKNRKPMSSLDAMFKKNGALFSQPLELTK